MDWRRLLPLGLGVTALLVLAGIASHGRPLSRTSRGAGPTASFFDYVFTSLVLVAIAIVVVVAYAAVATERGRPRQPVRRWYLLSAFATMLAAAAIASLLLRSGFVQRLHHAAAQAQHAQPGAKDYRAKQPPGSHVRPARLRWDEIGVVLALLAGTGAVVLAGWAARRRPLRPLPHVSHEALSLALDASLDDLRDEPDLRRAIIAAYARMEIALAAAGLPRRPAEAPFEYLERALGSLDTGADAVHRLTDLFEWAKFSHHEPAPEMRDEAIDALAAVRDELRRPLQTAPA